MDITKLDRDKLRDKQHKLNANLTIGNLVEHRTQDPKLYKQQSRSQGGSAESKPEMPKISHQSKHLASAAPIAPIEEDPELEMPISSEDVQANMWLNMDQVEFDKLEWMSTKAEKCYREQTKGSTRFDRDGRLIQSKPKTNGDHKAEEPAVEGHDVNSLIKLLDSTYQPQVIYSLNVVAKIASYATMGYYDGTFDESIHQLLLKDCLLRARFQMESANETTCLSAIKCMRSLLCNCQVDEVILDRIFPTITDQSEPNLWLETLDMTSKEFTIETTDKECVEIDAIKALVERTQLIIKFTHMLDTKTGTHENSYYDCILDILIRVARHSPTLASKINRGDLIPNIVRRFLPQALTTGNQHLRPLSTKALKLIRLVTEGMISIEEDQQTILVQDGVSKTLPSSLIQILNSYVTIECSTNSTSSRADDNLCKLALETIRCLHTFSRFEQFRADVVSLLAMNRDKFFVSFGAISDLNATKEQSSNISFDWQYAAHLIDLIGLKVKDERPQHVENLKSSIWSLFVRPTLLRWINDLTKSRMVPHLDVSIAIAAGLRHFRDRCDPQNVFDLHKHIITPILKNRQDNGPRSIDIFRLIARDASSKSQLSKHLETSGRMRDPTNLPSFGWLQFNSSPEHHFKLDPLFDSDSPFFLLDIYLSQLQKCELDLPETLGAFLDNPDLVRYLRSISGYQKQPMKYETSVQQSYAAQFEIRLIIKAILLISKYYSTVVKPEKSPIATRQDHSATIIDRSLMIKPTEDYGNLCYYAISVMGLLYDNDSLSFKDELFQRLLLNVPLQDKIFKENFCKPQIPRQQLVSFDSGEFTNPCSRAWHQIKIIRALYECCVPVDRFWIFQPVLLYYLHVIKDQANNQDENMRNPNWLIDNMPWRDLNAEILSSSDAVLMSAILNFNHLMMTFSAAYRTLVIRPNLEDYICMVGVLFLHDDLFLNDDVSKSLALNLRSMLNESLEGKKEFSTPLFVNASRVIETFDLPLADFFNRLVDQYEAVSYGDIAFTNLLLLFLSPQSDRAFKKKLFQEKIETCVKQLRITSPDVWIPARILFAKKESDSEIKEIYQRAKSHTLRGTFLHEFLHYHTQ